MIAKIQMEMDATKSIPECMNRVRDLRWCTITLVAGTRLRKKCGDCGTRGNWPKKIILDTCPECTSERLKHDAIRKQFYDRCVKREGPGNRLGVCQPGKGSQCEACKEYFSSATHKFWLSK